MASEVDGVGLARATMAREIMFNKTEVFILNALWLIFVPLEAVEGLGLRFLLLLTSDRERTSTDPADKP
jgi:hypothetical protein